MMPFNSSRQVEYIEVALRCFIFAAFLSFKAHLVQWALLGIWSYILTLDQNNSVPGHSASGHLLQSASCGIIVFETLII